MALGLPDLLSRIRIDTSEVDAVQGKLAGLGKGLALGLGAAVGGIGAFVVDSAHRFAEVGGEVLKLTRLTGESAESSSRLRFAAEETGVSVDDLGRSIGILSKHIAANDEAAASAGVSFRDAAGNARPLNGVLLDVAEKFKSMPDGIDKNALALRLFGRAGLQMIPFLNKGKEGLSELEKEADKFGLVLGKDNLGAIQANIKAHREFRAALDGLQVQIGQYVLPVVSKLTVGFTDFIVKVAHSDAFAAIRRGIGDFVSGMTEGTDALGLAQSRFASFGAAIRSVIGGIVDLLHGDVRGFAGELASAFGQTSTSDLAVGLEQVGRAITDVVSFLVAHPDEVKLFGEGLAALLVAEAVAGKINSLGGAVGGLVTKLNPANTELGRLVGNLAKVVSKTVSVTVEGVKAAVDGVQTLIDKLAGLRGQQVSVGVDAGKIDASGAADAGKKAAGSLAETIRNVLGNALGGAIGAGLAEGIAAVSLGAAATAIGVVAAAVAQAFAVGLAIHFRTEIIGFFTHTLPSLIGDALPAVGRAIVGFFADTLPGLLGDALGALAGLIVLRFVGVPLKIAQVFIDGVPGVVAAVGGFGLAVLRSIGGFVAQVPAAVGGALAQLPGLVADVFGQLASFAGQAVTDIAGFLAQLPGIVANVFLQLPAFAAQAVVDIVGFLTQLPGIVIGLVGQIPGAVAAIVSALPGIFADAFNTAVSIVGDALGAILNEVGSWPIVGVIGDIMGRIGQGVQAGWNFVDRVTGGALSEVTATVGRGTEAIVGFFAQLPGRIVGALGNLAGTIIGGLGDLASIGRAIIEGIIGGIGSMVDALRHKVSDVIGGAIGFAKSLLHIGSPSRVFHEIGRNVVAGLVGGLGADHGDVRSAMRDVADTLASVRLTPEMLTAAPAPAVPTAPAASAVSGVGMDGRPIVVQLVVNGREFAQVISSDMARALLDRKRAMA